jgi:hypothetical protein
MAMLMDISPLPRLSEVDRFDFCLVFPLNSNTKELSPFSTYIFSKIVELIGRKYFYLYYSSDKNDLYVLFRGGEMG